MGEIVAAVNEPKKAILFANGVRERILRETGGHEPIFEYFDYVLDASRLMKPWESKAGFDDFVHNDTKLHSFSQLDQLDLFLNSKEVTYLLLVGADYAKHLVEVTENLRTHRVRWGYLYNRGNFLGFAESRGGWRMRPLLRIGANSFVRDPCGYARHYFSNVFNPGKFVGISAFTRRVKINYRDYYFLQETPSRPNRDDPYLVFLDQSLPVYFQGYYDNETVVEEYYQHLNEYLAQISREYCAPVVVCLHPNAAARYREYFDSSFRVVGNATAAYVRKAKMIVTHYSLSVSYAVMLRKPVVNVYFSTAFPLECRRSVFECGEMLNGIVHRWPDPDSHNDYRIPLPAKNRKLMKLLVPAPDAPALMETVRREIDEELGRAFRHGR